MKPSLPAPSHVIADKYVVERSLGQGGMGAVYLVSHKVTGKKLALKCLLPQFVQNTELVERFLREAQAAGRIQHRHVVDVFDVGRDGQVLYIVMPYLEGKPLSLVLREQSLDLSAVLAIVLRAMEGVAAAHAQGIVHRDLKPDNIFVCVGPSGSLDDPRVLDFGISKLDDEAEQTLTKSGVLMGTPHYMSFEQLNSQRDIDARADVYALGCILYEAIAGKLPYVADSASALAIRMLTAPPRHLSELRKDLPPLLLDVVMKAIARDRDDRYRNVEDLVSDLLPFVPERHGLANDEARMSRAFARPAPAVSMAEANTVAADPSAPGMPALVAGEPARADASEAETKVLAASVTSPQLKLVNEAEGRKPAEQHTSFTFRVGALVAALLLFGAAALWLWPALTAPSSAGADRSRRSTPTTPSARAAERETSAADEGASKKPGRKVRKKADAKSGSAADTTLDPSGAPAAPGELASAADEDEDEDEFEVEASDPKVDAPEPTPKNDTDLALPSKLPEGAQQAPDLLREAPDERKEDRTLLPNSEEVQPEPQAAPSSDADGLLPRLNTAPTEQD